ncbi:PTS sugar transporter subunit IIB [Clostridium polynesiense]|uniref:PTS sugar transporter subunit IIB n=1 Tax=Clostridium polynesiense TaxID=1325933 RepID=UPI000694C4AB|nr:PTS sugar transporter subunit IIB [Clostridium polynesiense]
MKKVLVCCGTSMITSSLAINKLKKAFKEENLDVKIGQCKFSEVPGMIKTFQPDVIVPTGALNDKNTGGVPVIRGTSFITGVGEKETIKAILDIIK